MILSGLNHLTLAVTQLGRSIDFYQGVLCLRLAARWDTGAYLTAGDLSVCLSLAPQNDLGPRSDYTHYALSISQSDFSTFVERIRNLGSEGDSVYFLDPDGHKLEAHVGSLTTRLTDCRQQPYAGMEIFE
jgi:catechol 2,3-dioxygenase-like lactoylglutathione lyase family enzyme